MNVHELNQKFIKLKNYSPESVNELLDFAKKAYIYNEISTSDYRKLVRDLESQGATIPDEYKENTLIEN